jgi:hypothetical protein
MRRRPDNPGAITRIHTRGEPLRRTFALVAMTAVLSVSGVGVALAKAGDDGSPGNRGLCNAYAHNNQHAKDHGQSFARLVATAGDYNGDGTQDSQDVTDYCADNYPGGPSGP